MKKQYEDIIHLPHHQSTTHAHMSLQDRAAQFSPFAALKGYDDTIDEAGRWVDERRTADDDALLELNRALFALKEDISSRPLVCVTYFHADERKAGGFTRTVKERAVKIKEHEQILVLEHTGELSFSDLFQIEFL